MKDWNRYSRPSDVQDRGDALGFLMAADMGREAVQLRATVGRSGQYAQAMLALYQVVQSDHRFTQKDHSAYQAWVQQKYAEELMLDPELARAVREAPANLVALEEVRSQLGPLRTQKRALAQKISGNMGEARRKYWEYLRKHNFALWVILDPVVSVHPDGVIFEAFSKDESTYGRVTVPMELLDTVGEIQYGTTNVDFSRKLAGELERLRSYRPTFLEIETGGVGLATSAGSHFEKKIDLPPSWVRGFVQVQAASTLPATRLRLSASTLSEVLLVLKQRKEKSGPRCLRFGLVPGEKPTIKIEPWGLVIREPQHLWRGREAQEISIWGRRRLAVLEGLLASGGDVEVQLPGSGLPSYWSVDLNGHRFDLGLSGWTQNDWSAAARFEVLAAPAIVEPGVRQSALELLKGWRMVTVEEAATSLCLERPAAAATLAGLCREGLAMYDFVAGTYRYRQLLDEPVPADAGDEVTRRAAQLVQDNLVSLQSVQPGRKFEAKVGERGHTVSVTLDEDGRVSLAECSCSAFRSDGLRLGPCAHILATTAVASSHLTPPGEVSA